MCGKQNEEYDNSNINNGAATAPETAPETVTEPEERWLSAQRGLAWLTKFVDAMGASTSPQDLSERDAKLVEGLGWREIAAIADDISMAMFFAHSTAPVLATYTVDAAKAEGKVAELTAYALDLAAGLDVAGADKLKSMLNSLASRKPQAHVLVGNPSALVA